MIAFIILIGLCLLTVLLYRMNNKTSKSCEGCTMCGRNE